MAVEFKDYYQTLGVPRNASSDDIRKAFRTLARKYHPDVAKDKRNAEEKFKEINEAHEVLGNPENRKKYDELGADWKAGGPRPPPPGQTYRTYSRSGTESGRGKEGFEFQGTGFSDFFEQFFGARGGFEGHDVFGAPEKEKGRDVEGEIMVTLEEVMKGGLRQVVLKRKSVCPQCDGSGAGRQGPCPTCDGAGEVVVSHTYKVKIPAGVRDGQRLRVAGQGEPGSGGGAPGDMFLRVRLAGHPDFRVEGGDLYHDLELAPWEAALGARVSVPTLAEPVSIKIPPGTQNGQLLRVRSRGLPGRDGTRGDLYVIAEIQMPKAIGEREKELWEQLGRESRFKPRE